MAKKLTKKQRLKALLEVAVQDTVSKTEIKEFFQKLVKAVQDARVELKNTATERDRELTLKLENSLAKLQKNIESELKKATNSVEKRESKLASDTLQSALREIRRLEAKIPREADFTPIQREIERVRGEIPKIPKIPEFPSIERIRDQFEELVGDARLDKEAIRGLGKEFARLEKLAKRPATVNQRQTSFWRSGDGKSVNRLTVSSSQPDTPVINDLWVDTS